MRKVCVCHLRSLDYETECRFFFLFFFYPKYYLFLILTPTPNFNKVDCSISEKHSKSHNVSNYVTVCQQALF